MKKKIIAVITGVLLMGTLAGCSSQLSNQYITIKQYKGLEVPQVEELNVSDDQVLKQIDYYLAADSEEKEITDRAAQEGDTVNIDYVGKVDGTEFQGGTATGAALELGSGSYIGAEGDYKGFEEQIVGHKQGDEFDITVKFPDDYYSTDMAGKVAVFSIKLNKLYTVTTPELTDEWVKENSTESKTVDEYKEEIREKMENSELWGEVLDALVAKVDVKKYPEDEVKAQQEELTNRYKQIAENYGVEYEEFLSQYMGMTEDEFNEQVEQAARKSLVRQLAVELVADKKKLNISDKEYQIGLKRYASTSGYTSDTLAQFEEQYGEDIIKKSLLQEKVAAYLAKSCVQVEQEDETSETGSAASEDSSSSENSNSSENSSSSENSDATQDNADTAEESAE